MTRRKFVLIGVDGLVLDAVLNSTAAPHLSRFMEQGLTAMMTMEVPTISGPGWSSILTGASHAEHGVVDNMFHGHTLGRNADLLSRAFFADQSVTTYVAVSWPPLGDPDSVGPVVSARADQQRTGMHRLIVRDGEVYGYRRADAEIARISFLYLNKGAPDASFVYLGEIDEAGHLWGGASAEYRDAISRVDTHVGSLLDAISSRAVLQDEDWLVAITTDHGHLDEGGHGGGEDIVRRSFFAVSRCRGGQGEWSEEGLTLTPVIRPEQIASYLLSHIATPAA